MLIPLLLLTAARIVAPEPSALPYRQPQLAAAHGIAGMTFGAGPAIFYAASTDGGITFGRPVKVAEPGVVALGRHRGPHLAILKDVLVISAVVSTKVAEGAHAHGLPDQGELTVWRSTDHGRTWHRAGVVNDVPGATREGLHAMAAAPDGSLFAAWLDLRAKGTQLYGARSTDGGLTWSPNVRIYTSPGGTICQCCHPSLTFDETGAVWLMWRNALEGSRDLWVTHSADGVTFSPAHKLGNGTWKLEACPMDGGGLLVESGRVTSAWRREGELYTALDDRAERRIGSGKDVAIARGRRGIYTAWTSKEGAVVVLPPSADTPSTLAPEGGYVNLASLPDGTVLAAWETKEGIEFKRLE